MIIANKVYGTGAPSVEKPRVLARYVPAYEIASPNGSYDPAKYSSTTVISGGPPMVVHVIDQLAIATSPLQHGIFDYGGAASIMRNQPPAPASPVMFEARAFCGRRDTVESFGAVAPAEVTCPQCAIVVAPLWKQQMTSWRQRAREIAVKTVDAVRSVLQPPPEPVPPSPQEFVDPYAGVNVVAIAEMIGNLSAEIQEVKQSLAWNRGGVVEPVDSVNAVIVCECGHSRMPDPDAPKYCPGCGVFPATAVSGPAETVEEPIV